MSAARIREEPVARRPRTAMLSAADQPVGSTRTVLSETAADGSISSTVRRTVLPGGLRVVTEAMPGVRSAAFGIWVGVGSRDERGSQAGATHFLEHLLFKGTKRRTALDISMELDAVGGEANAFTAKENTCYYARVLDTDLPLAVDVVGDLVTSATVSAADVESERGVVLEELAMRDDDPSDLVQDLFAEAMWGDTPLGRSVLGTVESITEMPRSVVRNYYRRRYTAPRIVAAAAGNVDHADVVKLVRKAFATGGFLDGDGRPEAPRVPAHAPVARPGLTVMNRPTEQANLVLGMPALPRADDRRFVLAVLNAAVGGGMSSRLFQEIREKRGLAYSVYSFVSHFAETGMFGVAVGCQPKRAREVVGITREVLADVAAHGLPDAELALGKGQLRGGLVLGLEDSGARMSRIGKAELVLGEHPAVSEQLRRIDSVTPDEVAALAAELLSAAPTLAVVGPYKNDSAFAGLL